ncbi:MULTISPECIES: PspC family transcriptional regulator [Apibacter]|uniref:PspC family transcriptional regulator n=1 Tax=Apibacter TaxID=1778601 RepID=UPI000CF84C14|nr:MULTISPECIES: PspC family transcriptional regulator [Apibacter]MCX8677276.1 PspC family transcriptional regulator [Apibacter sp. B3919]MXO25596.1 PspC family transcriptional regulator [Apibacter sp. B3924]MXO26749.1 PspC family transcriptional regulator [Apibacter sp. B3813]MXO28681.1 PspC family transcriptional regulator [Apibacter sp. B3913]MXO30635.1 PspC family transcriptional regulator [Apibacter sp. B3912]
MIEKLRTLFEANGFEVISRVSEKFGVRASKLRLLFIYLSFITLGGIFALYLTGAFFLWIKDSIITKRPSVFDL